MSTPAGRRRTNLAAQLLAEGVPLSGVVDRVASHFRCSRALAAAAMQAAQREAIHDLVAVDRPEITVSSIARLQYVAQLAVERGDLGAALKAEAQIAELLGISAKTLQENTSKTQLRH